MAVLTRVRSRKASLVFAFASLLSLTSCTRRLLYARTNLDDAALASLAEKPGWRSATLTVGDVELNGLVRAPSSARTPWILYFGGNATSLEGSVALLERLREKEDIGLAVFAYRGYDGSDGTPTQRRLTADGVAAAKQLETLGMDPSRLVIVGQSLGSGVGAQVTATLQEEGRAPGGLVLVSPFMSVPQVAREHVFCAPTCLFPDRWRTLRRAPELRVPALVLHGTKDTIIPPAHGEAVAAALPDARFVPVPGRDHNDVWTPDALAVVRAFVLERAR
jgi:uncharacterized protein